MHELGCTIAEIAARLEIHPQTVYKLIRDGHLEHHDYPGIGKRITEEQLQRFLDGYRIPATADRATA